MRHNILYDQADDDDAKNDKNNKKSKFSREDRRLSGAYVVAVVVL